MKITTILCCRMIWQLWDTTWHVIKLGSNNENFWGSYPLRNLENNSAPTFLLFFLLNIFVFISSTELPSPFFGFFWMNSFSLSTPLPGLFWTHFNSVLSCMVRPGVHYRRNPAKRWTWLTLCSPRCTPFCEEEWTPFANRQKYCPVSKLALLHSAVIKYLLWPGVCLVSQVYCAEHTSFPLLFLV